MTKAGGLQKLLARQLKRELSLADDAALESVLASAEQLATAQPQPLAHALRGLRALLQRVDEAYAQYDRDLLLSSRSLSISSDELLEANLRIRAEADAKQRVIQALRESVRKLALGAGVAAGGSDDADLQGLYERVAQLIAGHQAAQSRLAASEAKFRDLLELSSDWYWEQDAELRFVSTGGRKDERGGLSADDHVGRCRWELPGTFPVSCTWDEHRAVLTARKAFRDLILRREAADGTHYVQVAGRPLYDANGNFAGYQGVARDVTQKQLAEEELRRARAAADAANEAKSRFVANVSHEIRTPMNGVLGIAELLLADTLTPRQRERVQLLADSGRSLLAIINDILDFSKMEAGRLDFERIEFEPRQVVEQVARLLAPQARAKGLQFNVDCDPTLGRTAIGDPLRLQQALTNLLGNAIKFTERGTVNLHAWSIAGADDNAQRYLRFEVEDSGIGLAPEVAAGLFTPFSQADVSTTRRFGGTGLGLAISRHIVERMGGRIGVRSEPGRGSLFWFEVRLELAAQAARTPAATDAAVHSDPDAAGARVLLVEDIPVNILVAQSMLERLGYSVTVEQDGEAGLQAMRRLEFDAVLMDCQMPRMDGYEAVRQRRREESAAGRPRLPIIALTANTMVDDVERCLAAGFDGHIGKPMSLEQLRTVLSCWLPASSGRRDAAALAKPRSP